MLSPFNPRNHESDDDSRSSQPAGGYDLTHFYSSPTDGQGFRLTAEKYCFFFLTQQRNNAVEKYVCPSVTTVL